MSLVFYLLVWLRLILIPPSIFYYRRDFYRLTNLFITYPIFPNFTTSSDGMVDHTSSNLDGVLWWWNSLIKGIMVINGGTGWVVMAKDGGGGQRT